MHTPLPAVPEVMGGLLAIGDIVDHLIDICAILFDKGAFA